MPELKEWMVRVGKVEDGVWMRRGAGPRSPMVIAVDNKENLPPWRSARRRRSPLPAWYPRTPLRDITVIVRVRSLVLCFLFLFWRSVNVFSGFKSKYLGKKNLIFWIIFLLFSLKCL